MNPEISIIVPIYKAEAYLNRCIDSILSQTFKDFELLLIDDGSPDKSGEICDEYSKRDIRVRVIHKKNGGVSSARQLGIEQAKGNYTIHADPDDWIEPNMLRDMHEVIIREQADLVIADFWIEKPNKTEYCKQRPNSLNHIQILKDLFQQLHGSCCNKLIKSACYKKYDIRFPEKLNYCEDVIFWVQLLQHPLKITYLPNAYYYYDKIINKDSLTQVYSTNTLDQHMLFIDYLKKYLTNEQFLETCNIAVLNVAYDEFIHNSLYNKPLLNLARKNKSYISALSKPKIVKILFYIALFYNNQIAFYLYKIAYSIKQYF